MQSSRLRDPQLRSSVKARASGPESAPDMIYSRVRRLIVDGELADGAQLRQDELGARFGVSRIPVREALRRLESEGLVAFHTNRGAIVSALSLADALELLDIRVALECRALRLAVPNMTEADFERIAVAEREYARCQDVSLLSELNREFHLALCLPADRPRLLEMITETFDKLGRFMRLQVSMATGKQRPAREHREIVRACRDGDVEKAAKLLEAHVIYSQKALQAAAREAEQRRTRHRIANK